MIARRQTFTLIEMLVVISVIAILAGITIGGGKFAFDKSQESAIKMRIKKMEMALEEYKKDWGYYPIWQWDVDHNGDGSVDDDDRQLCFFPGPDKKFGDADDDGDTEEDDDNRPFQSPNGKLYLKDGTDPYLQRKGGSAMQYEYPGTHNTEKYDLQAPGLDKVFDTDDDITNWTER